MIRFRLICLLCVALLTRVALAASPDNTVLTGPTTATIIDAAGNTWGISPAACTAPWAAAGSTRLVTLNGKADATTCSVIAMAYEKGVVWQQNASKQWYSKVSATGSWLGPVLTSPVPVPVTTQSATLTWLAPTLNTNGTMITAPMTYNIYQGLTGAPLVKVQSGVTQLVAIIHGLAAGTTPCFAVTAVENGVEGVKSSPPACLGMPPPIPNLPTSLKVTVP